MRTFINARTWMAWPAAVGLLLLTGCGSIGDERAVQYCPTGSPLDSPPPCDCTSWTWYLEWDWWSEVEPDLSASPAQVDITVGQSFGVAPSIDDERPRNCNRGFRNGREVVRSTNPSVVAFESSDGLRSTFVGAAPGSASLVAEGLATPGGQLSSADLTVCADLNAAFGCSNRVPLVIRVVP
jgi:hypothetical protein